MKHLLSFVNLVDLFSKLLIPIIIGYVTYLIAKRQIANSGVTQFRQNWINELRSTISLFISKAELISILDVDDEKNYREAFKDFCQCQYKIELLLNPNESDHNSIITHLEKIRQLIHTEDEIDEEELDQSIVILLEVTKRVLKREWQVVKRGK
jgi:hypothetical protein